ncbi:MAG: class I SAM-dependent methyltransferase [Roseiflexaceae bacterium]|jgi:ubiquinone/menaquinone biosynthesis C-methylase UbiE|nr:class I SAM-dependent methyltransferase [Chloroflexaceae bacterium]
MYPRLRRLYQWMLARLYAEFAPIYDTVATLVSRGHWFLWGDRIIPLLNAPILELGCGTGHLQQSLAQRGITAIGIDRSLRMLSQAARRATTLVCADSTALPWAAGTFASVVAVFPAPYIMAPTTLHEVARVLQPDGQLVILLAAGRLDLTTHPLTIQLREYGWQVALPSITAQHTRLCVVVARPPHAT